jgi:hypothetical protein
MDQDALGPSGGTWRTDTAERPAVVVPPEPAQPVAPVLPPPLPDPPRERRADQRPTPRGPRGPRQPAPAWIAWVVVAALLVLAAIVGVRLALQPPGESTVAVDTEPDDRIGPGEDQPSEPADEEEQPAEEAPEEEAPAKEVVGFSALPAVTVPGAAGPNNDVTGELVTFVGDNMLDSNPATCWRIGGDASGSVLTFTYPSEVTVARVGLVNGYAKTSVDGSGRSFDWYAGNRRITQVEWLVGDQVFPQTLTETRSLQLMDVEPTPATEIGLRIVSVSAPGPGPTGRDYTAISDIGIEGWED